MAIAEREPITGVWRRSPQRGPGQSPDQSVRGQSPLKLKAFYVSEVQMRCTFVHFMLSYELLKVLFKEYCCVSVV